MGAFVLYKSDHPVDGNAIRSVFQKKGFAEPAEFCLGPMTLWLYQKQLVDEENFHFENPTTAVFATGTIVYRGKSYKESLETLLVDFRNGALDFDEMLGSFCLIFFVDNRIHVLTDRLNVHHVFMDQKATRLSSSFLAMLVSTKEPLPLNRLAFYEKISTGYIIGPDTLVEGISQLTDALQQRTRSDSFSFVHHPPRSSSVEYCSSGLDECVEHQILVLRKYFEDISPLAQQYGPELGLSGGYDSRLVLALSKGLPQPLTIHTHLTKGVGSHEADKLIVPEMAGICGSEWQIVETTSMEEKSEDELAAVLADGLYYFDGRNSHNMGAFSETYTRRYKMRTLGDRRMSLNGLGGEMYRNYYFASRRRFSFRQFMLNKVYYDQAVFAVPGRRLFDEMHECIVRKMADTIGIEFTGSIDQLALKRYYSEIRMPDCDGINNNAHNQLAFFLTPFIEWRVVREAYKALPYIGRTGTFQAALIRRQDENLADVTSHYGFPLSQERLSHVLVAGLLRGYVPDRLWNFRARLRTKYRGLGMRDVESFQRLTERSGTMKEIAAVLGDLAPPFDLGMCLRDSANRATVVFLGSLLREFHSHIRN